MAGGSQLSMKKVVARSGIRASALRFYERKGLIVAERDSSGRRFYRRHILRRLAVIRAGQAVGLSLEQISMALAAVPLDRPPTRQEWVMMSQQWRSELDLRVAALLQLRDSLTGCIGCGCLSLDSCPLSNPEDILGEAGPGARIWTALKSVENEQARYS